MDTNKKQTVIISAAEVKNLEKRAALANHDEYPISALAYKIKKWSLYIFAGVTIAVVVMGIGETVLINCGMQVGELFEESFEACKLVCTTLLGFTFATKLDELSKQ